MLTLATHQPIPAKFKVHTLKKEYVLSHEEKHIWKWLNDPNTFTKNQIWPYRVEFIQSSGHKSDFETGVFNTHHGPFMSFTGILGEIKPNYRDLKYLYGSYFLSMRWIRPHRLQFWTKNNGNTTTLTLQLDSYVNPGFYKFWNWSQQVFWSRFGRWMNKAISKSLR